MKQPHYPFESDRQRLSFTFVSEGANQVVQKLVEFVSIGGDIYNLAFGDLNEKGEMDDLKVTDNKDMELVMATVLQITLTFFETYPDKKFFFTGSTPSRTRLYQLILNREHQSLSQYFIVKGAKLGDFEPMQPNESYEAFLIQTKNR